LFNFDILTANNPYFCKTHQFISGFMKISTRIVQME